MATLLSILKYLVGGFIGLVALLFILALLFGKRVRKQWEFDADFHDSNGKEIGELDIELSRIEKEEENDTLKAKLRLKHSALRSGAPVEVRLNDVLIMAGTAKDDGRVYLTSESLVVTALAAEAGQTCSVVSDGATLCSAELVPD